jgi:hypothetical protein
MIQLEDARRKGAPNEAGAGGDFHNCVRITESNYRYW